MEKRNVERSDAENIASMRPLFEPRAVAVVGVSRNSANIGHRILSRLIGDGFRGPIYAINPHAAEIEGIPTFPSLRDVAQPIDLAIIATPRDAVIPTLEECAAVGIRAAIIITAGFAEIGAPGRDLQQKLLETARRHRIRIVGPNCLGLINADPAIRLNASFSPVFPHPGRIAMSSQSGALGIAVLSAVNRFGLGVSSFVSVGNKADVSGNDLMEYWEADANTDIILLYLESFGNPRRFARIARRVSRQKPIIALKSGRSASGGRAAGSHTAALAAKEVAVDALFHQTGVLRVETLEEFFDVASVLSQSSLPAGRRVGIVTNAGGPGILAADACESHGLLVPALSAELRARLAQFLPPAAGLNNPIDMIASASPEQFQKTMAAVLASGEFDAIIVEYVSVGIASAAEIAAAIERAVAESRTAGGHRLPVLACFMTEEEIPARFLGRTHRLPLFAFPESAASALSRAVEYSTWKSQPLGDVPNFEHDFAPARAWLERRLTEHGPGWLGADECRDLLTIAGFTVPPGGTARSEDQAVSMAQQVGFPVSAKLASKSILHKSDVGGVILNRKDDVEVRQAFRAIRDNVARLGSHEAFDGVLIQPMIRDAVELVAGMTHDPQFGPLVMFGLGGIYVEILRDVCFRITPLTDRDAAEMVRSIRGYRLLEGFRGHPRCDIAAVELLLLRLSGLVEAAPEIVELDLNPIMALPDGRGCTIVDARMRVRRSDD